MKILLTGASSYVGARLYFDLAKAFDVIGTYSSNQLSKNFIHLDATDQEEVNILIQKIHPDIIIHAANNASATWCEANPKEAVIVNMRSTEYLVDAANTLKAKLIYISSLSANDKSNVYGQTKSASETITKQAKHGYLIIRPSLIIGMSPNTKNDRPFNRILKNLDKRTPAVYDTSWKFLPTYIGQISEVIRLAIERNIWGETIAITVPELKSRYDIAKDILKPYGITVTPVDNHDTTKVLTDDLSKLEEFGLPQYSYDTIIRVIVAEIRERKKFQIVVK